MAYALGSIVIRSPSTCFGDPAASVYHHHAQEIRSQKQTPWLALNKKKQKLGSKVHTAKPQPSGDVYGCIDGGRVDKAGAGSLVSASFPHSILPTKSSRGELLASAVATEEPILSPRPNLDDVKTDTAAFLTITVLGATGDLATSKIFPALFALYYSGHLPENVAIFGYSRSPLTDEDLRTLISDTLTCRVDHAENCGDKEDAFLRRVFYQSGVYNTCEHMQTLDNRILELEGDGPANRMFYLSVPSECLLEVASCLSVNAKSKTGWTRLIVEKPFGNDAESSASLTNGLYKAGFTEDQIFSDMLRARCSALIRFQCCPNRGINAERIDHLLGKDLIENLTVLRFSNLVFEPLWSRTYIKNVQFIYSEDWGVCPGRGRYFDEQGVIRDLVQSHLLQIIALFAMEPPVSLDGEDIRNEKVKVLRSVRKPTFDDVVLGQYKASVSKDGKSRIPGYLDEHDVRQNSLTPTFVATIMYIDNARWDGVPFLVKAGKGLIKHTVEIRIQFRHVPGNLYRERFGFNLDAAANELVLRVQPDEAIYLKINNKLPGLGLLLDSSELNLLYRDKYEGENPDSYERLILDVIDGDTHLFLRGDELAATWEILTPLLEEIENEKVAPELYTFGGRGPIGAYYLGAQHNVKWADD